MTQKDLFSNHSDTYARYRPTYPHELFAWLSMIAPDTIFCWDCGTGNGQAALALAAHFEKIVATDLSEKQVKEAPVHPQVEFRVAPAEKSGLPDKSVSLVTVAQAFHWFQHDAFYAEVKRVTKSGGVLAIWCYELCHITPEVDAAVKYLYRDVLNGFWDPERKMIETGYREVKIPFHELESSPFEMKLNWNVDHLIGYLKTWSAVQKYIKAKGSDPVDACTAALKNAWGTETERPVVWPLSLRCFKI